MAIASPNRRRPRPNAAARIADVGIIDESPEPHTVEIGRWIRESDEAVQDLQNWREVQCSNLTRGLGVS
eukprot:8201581-Alexandrium_andersonii.AAC.1